MLLERLIDSEAEDRLDRLIAQRALAGPEVMYSKRGWRTGAAIASAPAV